MPAYKLIASDMDETLLADDHSLPPANVEALKRLHELGVLFVPCSGRPYASIMQNFEGIDHHLLEQSYVIGYNGGSINRYGDSSPLQTCDISNATAEKLLEQGLHLGLCTHIYLQDGTILVLNAPAFEKDRVRGVRGVVFLRARAGDGLASFTHGSEIAKMIYMDSDFAALKHIGAGLQDKLRKLGIDISYSSQRYLELMPHGINKGTGVSSLAKMLGISMDEVICMGDSSNDLAMIEVAGLGVGVANVTDDVRPACDVVLEATGADGALAEVVERFF